MALLHEKSLVDLIGPLGNGYPEAAEDTLPVLVAGGYGNAALYLKARSLKRKGIAFFGGRTAEDILCVEEFEALGWNVRPTTNDGSLGIQGLVTDAFDPWLLEQTERSLNYLYAVPLPCYALWVTEPSNTTSKPGYHSMKIWLAE